MKNLNRLVARVKIQVTPNRFSRITVYRHLVSGSYYFFQDGRISQILGSHSDWKEAFRHAVGWTACNINSTLAEDRRFKKS